MYTKQKYHNKKVTVNGIAFDSRKEARRYTELCLAVRAGKISDLKTQVEYELIPAQYEEIPTGEIYLRGEKKGELKKKRVCVEKAVKYVADFVYTVHGKTVVEDTKGMRTKDYIIKRKLMLYVHHVRIREV